MAGPAQVNIDIWAGNTFRTKFEIKNDDNTPFDLTGSKMVFKVKSTTVDIRKASDESGSGLEITDAAAGEVELFLTVENTRAMPAGKHKYELERWIGIDQTSLLYGELIVTVWVNDDVDP